MVAASIQMNCIATPTIADIGEMDRNAPPTFHWYLDATTSPNPAMANPIFPVSHRKNADDSMSGLTSGADTANMTAHTPDTMVNAPDTAKRAGTRGVPSRSRMIQVLNKYQAAATSVTPATNRAAPPNP